MKPFVGRVLASRAAPSAGYSTWVVLSWPREADARLGQVRALLLCKERDSHGSVQLHAPPADSQHRTCFPTRADAPDPRWRRGRKRRSRRFSEDSPTVAGARLPQGGARSGGRARGLGCAPASCRFSACGQDSASPAAQPTWAGEPW